MTKNPSAEPIRASKKQILNLQCRHPILGGCIAARGTEIHLRENCGVVLIWSGKTTPSKPNHPFSSSVTNFFDPLYTIKFEIATQENK